MSSNTPLPNIRVAVCCGPELCDTEEGRCFLQARLALFGKICCIVTSVLYVLLNLFLTVSGERPWSHWVASGVSQLHLACALAFLAVWRICKSSDLMSRARLALLDAGSVFVVGVLIGLIYATERYFADSDYPGIVGLASILFVRSFAVPSSARQTIAVSVLAALPVVAGYGVFAFQQAASAGEVSHDSHMPEVHAVLRVAVFACFCAASAAIAAIASRITYGLQQEVRDARELGQYTLEERIGKGGMGEVYRASHALLRRPTAVKVLRPENAGEKSIARFEREVQLTSRLTHPNTIAIYDFGRTPEGVFYYAMEFLDGLNLEDLVRRDGPQRPARAIHILRQVCASLSEAHGVGLIHRDIKPANIFLCDRGGVKDVVKVLDFGLVKDTERRDGVELTGVNTITGSPLYLSPEAIRSPDAVDARSDVYALGAVAYFLLAGKPVFDSTNVVEICGHHLHTRPVPPSQSLGDALPHDLERLILECLEKDPARRPQSARALRERLEACADASGWTEADAEVWWREAARNGGTAPLAEPRPHPARDPQRDAQRGAPRLVARGPAPDTVAETVEVTDQPEQFRD